MLSAWELADMRATQGEVSDLTCTVKIPGTPVSSAGGESPGAWESFERSCRVMDLAGYEREVGGRLTGVADVMITLEWHEDTIPYTAQIIISGVTYEIVRVASESTQPVGLRVYGQRIV